jgi:hypothetical protein
MDDFLHFMKADKNKGKAQNRGQSTRGRGGFHGAQPNRDPKQNYGYVYSHPSKETDLDKISAEISASSVTSVAPVVDQLQEEKVKQQKREREEAEAYLEKGHGNGHEIKWDAVQDDKFSILEQLDISEEPMEFKPEHTKGIQIDTDWSLKPYAKYLKWDYPKTRVKSDPTFVSQTIKIKSAEGRNNHDKFMADILKRAVKRAKSIQKKNNKVHKRDGYVSLRLKRKK